MKKENSSQTENKGVNHGTKHTEGTKKTVQKRSSGAKGKSKGTAGSTWRFGKWR